MINFKEYLAKYSDLLPDNQSEMTAHCESLFDEPGWRSQYPGN